MDPKDHKLLADKAYQKATEMMKKEEFTMELLDFAHGARLHYAYSSFDKEKDAVQANLRKASELLDEIYNVPDIQKIIQNR